MEPTYTKEQLIKGMELYYKNYNDNPECFYSDVTDYKQSAEECINYLIELIDEK